MKLALQNIRLPLAEFDLTVDTNLEITCTGLSGPSGAGKTSLLDLIAGLRRAPSARIACDDRILTDTAAAFQVPVHLRRIGYVPQDLALFPHLDVRRNLLYGHRPDTAPAALQFEHVADVLEIAALLDRPVSTLSGGQKQRVALGRALLSAPALLLLDEPLSSLDRPLRERLIPYLQRVRDEFRLPMLFVSHDAAELSSLCHEVLRLEGGRIVSGA